MAIQKGTGFTNLNRIMQANRGNKLGQTVAGGIQGQVQGVQTKVKSAQEQFQEEAQKNRLDTAEAAAKRSEVLNRFTPSSGASAVQQPAATPAPTQAQQTPTAQPAAQSPVSDDEIKEFNRFRAGAYTGPKELQDAGSLYGQAQQAEELGSLARSASGKQELLRRFVGGKNYSSGQKQLDASILGQEPGQLNTATGQARGLVRNVDRTREQASNLAQEYANRAKLFAEETKQQVAQTRDPLSVDLDRRVKAAQDAEAGRLSDFKELQEALNSAALGKINPENQAIVSSKLDNAIAKGYISAQDAEFLRGSTAGGGFNTRASALGLDVNSLLAQGMKNTEAKNINRFGLASDADVANFNALDALAGKEGTDREFLPSLVANRFTGGESSINLNPLRKGIYTKEDENASNILSKFNDPNMTFDEIFGYGRGGHSWRQNYSQFAKSGYYNYDNPLDAFKNTDYEDRLLDGNFWDPGQGRRLSEQQSIDQWKNEKALFDRAENIRRQNIEAQRKAREGLAMLAEGQDSAVSKDASVAALQRRLKELQGG